MVTYNISLFMGETRELRSFNFKMVAENLNMLYCTICFVMQKCFILHNFWGLSGARYFEKFISFYENLLYCHMLL